MNARSPFIGIDFGTSTSKMAWYNPKTKEAAIIMNAEGEPETPSVVYFGKDETLVGNPALEMLEYEEERERVIPSIKRELTTTPIIALPGRSVKPVEVAAEILRKLKRDAEERHFHQQVTRAVVTYPASFGPLDRDKIREATRLAGFTEIEMVEEPVAAAMAYTQMGLQVGKYVLVYDLGGGTFDLAVLNYEDDGAFRLALEPQGIKRCGGDDFDEALYNYCDAIAREKLGRAVSLTTKRDLHFLQECRKRKENLSNAERHMFNSLLSGDVIFRHEITRANFEGLISKLVEETVRKTKLLLEETSAQRQAVDTVVLIGGSSRVPLVKRLLEGNLPLKPLQWQYQDTAVALGAAYYAQNKWGGLGAEKTPVDLYGSAGAMADQYYCVKCKRKTEMRNPKRVTTKNGKSALKGSCAVCGSTIYSILGSEKKKETVFESQKRERYLKAVKLAWSGKQLDKAKIERLTTLAKELELSNAQVAKIEREVMGGVKETLLKQQIARAQSQYRTLVEAEWASRKLDKAKIGRLTARAKELALSKQEMTQIERAVMGAAKELIFRRQRQEQYRKAVEAEWKDHKLDGKKITRLTALAKELALSKTQVTKIEREVMGDIKESIFARQSKLQPAPARQATTITIDNTPAGIYNRATSGIPILNDPLSKNTTNNWDQYVGKGYSCAFLGGAYHVNMQNKGYATLCFCHATNFSNFAFQVQMTIVKGDGGGLIFRADNTKSKMYRFRVSQDGSYDLFVVDGNKGVYLISGSSSAIKTGLNQPNLLTVIAQANHIYLYVNKRYIADVTVSTATSGMVGLFAVDFWNQTELVFRDAKAWKL
jgi:actin-like ATPase involved in cell morphogenesis